MKTKTPWVTKEINNNDEYNFNGLYDEKKEYQIGDINLVDDSKFIVTAVNNHDKLVDNLKALHDFCLVNYSKDAQRETSSLNKVLRICNELIKQVEKGD